MPVDKRRASRPCPTAESVQQRLVRDARPTLASCVSQTTEDRESAERRAKNIELLSTNQHILPLPVSFVCGEAWPSRLSRHNGAETLVPAPALLSSMQSAPISGIDRPQPPYSSGWFQRIMLRGGHLTVRQGPPLTDTWLWSGTPRGMAGGREYRQRRPPPSALVPRALIGANRRGWLSCAAPRAVSLRQCLAGT